MRDVQRLCESMVHLDFRWLEVEVQLMWDIKTMVRLITRTAVLIMTFTHRVVPAEYFCGP